MKSYTVRSIGSCHFQWHPV